MSWIKLGLIFATFIDVVIGCLLLVFWSNILKFTERNKIGFRFSGYSLRSYAKVEADVRLSYFLIGLGLLNLIIILIWPVGLSIIVVSILYLLLRKNSTLKEIGTILRRDLWEDSD
jgi:hypothetical protein